MSNQTARQKLSAKIAAQSTALLVESFGLTDSMTTGLSAEDAAPVYITRGAIMDELERRHPDAFDAWIDSAISDNEAMLAAFAGL